MKPLAPAALLLAVASSSFAAPATIVCLSDAPSQVRLAAKELRRHLYLRTGELLPIAAKSDAGAVITFAQDPSLGAQDYRLVSDGKRLVIAGGSPTAELYGAYDFIGKFGTRFYLHGDAAPDAKVPFALPVLNETRKPLFESRGILPFHDFSEGPDWWTTDDYKAVAAQLGKMRMNFLGLHCYPDSHLIKFIPEPLVWHGLPQDVKEDGKVTWSYPASWCTTNLPNNIFNYAPMKTGEFAGGAAQLFADDWYGSSTLKGLQFPQDDQGSIEMTNRVSDMLGAATKAAHDVGIKVCIGTEIPMSIPRKLAPRLQAMGKNPNDPAVVREIYRGTFARLARAVKPDYYWLWTDETWTWRGNSQAQLDAATADFKAAIGAWEDLGKPFSLATCGWVLGPQQDRSGWSKLLPPGAPIACISRNLGHDPIEPTFSNVKDRPAWAIPWMENDVNMTAYQPWAKRMRFDAADARRRGCSGLMGIHWRTSIISPSVSALAQAGWDQSYAPERFFSKAATLNLGHVGNFGAKIEGAKPAEVAVYQSLRWGLEAYPVEVPNGNYTVTLKFCEVAYDGPDKRVFSVKVQDKPVADKLDIFAKAGGKYRTYDLVVKDVRVKDGRLNLTFGTEKDYPCISGIEITGTTDAANQVAAQAYTKKINVGGPAIGDFAADAAVNESAADRNRTMPADDFYLDFAKAHFGEAIANDASKILAQVDGTLDVSGWGNGPGNVKVIGAPWSEVKKTFAWVDDFAALRPRITGKNERERFDQCLATYRATATIVEVGCMRWELDKAMQAVTDEKDATKKKALAATALQARLVLARGWEKLMGLEVQSAITSGELGTINNLEARTRLYSRFLDWHDANLTAALGEPLPANVQVSTTYNGPARVFTLTRRDRATKGEVMNLPIIALDKAQAKSVTLRWRKLGEGAWQTLPARHVGRAVWQSTLPAATEDREYFIEAQTATGATFRWPADGAQSVIVEE